MEQSSTISCFMLGFHVWLKTINLDTEILNISHVVKFSFGKNVRMFWDDQCQHYVQQYYACWKQVTISISAMGNYTGKLLA